MRRLTKVSLITGLLAPILFAAVFAVAAPKKEYLTEDELDLIRDAQELSARVSTYFKLADRRLVFLGIKEKSQEQIEKERKEREKLLKEQKKSTDTRATANKAPIDDTAYLDDFTHAELLRGYIQVLDEVTDNLDNAFTSRQDVRDPLEDLAKFTRESLPLLEKYKPKNDSEKVALQDAIDRSKEVAAQTKEALTQVPKTEKKRK